MPSHVMLVPSLAGCWEIIFNLVCPIVGRFSSFRCLNINVTQISFPGVVTGRRGVVTETGVLKRGATVVSVRGGMIAITMTGMGRVDLVPMTKGEVTGGVMEITVGAGVFDCHLALGLHIHMLRINQWPHIRGFGFFFGS